MTVVTVTPETRPAHREWTLDESLRELNFLREALGLAHLAEMPPGKLSNAEECPVALATGAHACRTTLNWRFDNGLYGRIRKHRTQMALRRHGYDARIYSDRVRLETPPAVRWFIDSFDGMMLPELAR